MSNQQELSNTSKDSQSVEIFDQAEEAKGQMQTSPELLSKNDSLNQNNSISDGGQISNYSILEGEPKIEEKSFMAEQFKHNDDDDSTTISNQKQEELKNQNIQQANSNSIEESGREESLNKEGEPNSLKENKPKEQNNIVLQPEQNEVFTQQINTEDRNSKESKNREISQLNNQAEQAEEIDVKYSQEDTQVIEHIQDHEEEETLLKQNSEIKKESNPTSHSLDKELVGGQQTSVLQNQTIETQKKLTSLADNTTQKEIETDKKQMEETANQEQSASSYQFILDVQKRQMEFQQQMEELNRKYKINFRKIVDVKQESLSGNYLAGLLAIKMNYKYVDTKDQYGFTMLHHAVLGNERELVLFLLNNGADVNSLDAQQRTPLMMAAHGGSSLPAGNVNQQKGLSEDQLNEESEDYQKVMKLHSFNKIFKILIDRGANFSSKDIYAFSPLLYSIQTQHLLIFFYLVYLGANIYDSDMNGSSVVHWNAYKGNRFMMEVFRSLNMDLFTADNQGYTPLSRSLMGISYDTFTYLAEQVAPETLPDPDQKQENEDEYVILSESIRHDITMLKKESSTLKYRFFKWWQEKNVQAETTGLYPAVGVFFLMAAALFYTSFTAIYSERNRQNGGSSQGWLQSSSFLINIFFFVSTFVFMSFSIRLCGIIVSYKNRHQGTYVIDGESIDRQNQLKLEQERQIPSFMKNIMSDGPSYERLLQRMNFKHLDRVLENAHFQATRNATEDLNQTMASEAASYDEETSLGVQRRGNSTSNLTFIHQIAILFENNCFTSLGEVDFKRLCGVCLKYKAEKMKHCKKCNTCVAYYSFHSTLFNVCICAQNYFFYLIHLFSMWLSLFSFFLIQYIQFSQYLTSWSIFRSAELAYIISQRIGLIHSFVFVTAIIIFLYCCLDCALELFAIFEDKTRDEILNPFDYPYNYEVTPDKKGYLLKVPKIRTNGMVEYLKATLATFYYRTFVHLKAKK